MIKPKQKISILSITLGSGGAEKVISLLLKELIKDYSVTLVLFYNSTHFPIPEEVNVVVLANKKPEHRYFFKFLDSVNFIIQYYRFIKKENITISISFLAFPNLINGVLATFNKNIKTIISERGFPSDNITSKLSLYISKLFYPVFYNKCNKLFSNSLHINKDLKENFGVKIPMDVIYNPIELPNKTINPKALDHNCNALKIITAGTLNTRKNHVMILKALHEIKTNDKLTILGGGHLESYLIEQIEILKLKENVILQGTVKYVNDYLINSHCFILSSFTEGFPNALIEAMAIGLPCISTNCLSGPLELLNENQEIDINFGEFYIGKYGLLVNNDDHIGLSKAILFYKNNRHELEKFSALSLKRAQEYQLTSIYKKFNQFISN